jgi:hypothetical protein
MSTRPIAPPEADEYAPFYAGYIALVREHDAVGVLKRQVPAMRATLEGISESEALARYAPGKWSIKQVIGHLGDTERVMSYRLLRIARGDQTPLSGFDENFYVDAGGFEHRPLKSLVAEFEKTRAATLPLIETVPADAWTRMGSANGAALSARALLYILAGHVEHHSVILRERYGLPMPYLEAPPA